MYYRYDENSIIIEKSETELSGENVCFSTNDFNIELYKVYVGLVDADKKLNYYKVVPRTGNIIVQKLEALDDSNTTNEEYITELLYQICLLQLGEGGN